RRYGPVPSVPWSSRLPFASPFEQTSCTSARPWIMNGFGEVVVTTTVRAPLFAVTFAPIGMNSPSSGDMFAGLPTKSRFCFTTDAVIFVPSEHEMLRRSVNSTFFGEITFHDCARPDAIFPGPVRLTSVSYAYVSTYRAACRSVSCGSRLPGSVGTETTAEPDGPAVRRSDEPSAD